MPNKICPWFMRLTMVNQITGQSTFAMYPQDKYSLLESLDCCQLPYGNGEYMHLAASPNKVTNSLQIALTGVIESMEHPPSIKELNHLGEQIQRMSPESRADMERQLADMPNGIITDAINATHRLLFEDIVYDGVSLSDRPLLLGEDEPYIRVQLVPDDDKSYDGAEDGVWLNCPAGEDEPEAAAKKLGVDSGNLRVNTIDGLLATSDLDIIEVGIGTFSDINNLAYTMKEYGIVQEMGKFKAILEFESCVDFGEAAVLAGKLEDYEFYRQADLCNRYQSDTPGVTCEELADDLGFEQSTYGFIRNSDEQRMEHIFQ